MVFAEIKIYRNSYNDDGESHNPIVNRKQSRIELAEYAINYSIDIQFTNISLLSTKSIPILKCAKDTRHICSNHISLQHA